MVKFVAAVASVIALASLAGAQESAEVKQGSDGPRALAAPRLTPRGSTVPLYPAPAVAATGEGGVLGPYGPGLAAAAPVGTPYLRSPAFAGPPVIYMPQTVTRVLVPASTPYPSQVMPTRNYVYASAPFLRTDIYVNLPYGTYYWPQGYAGTVPVEPSMPAYVMAPSTAMSTTEASYAAQRYIPGARKMSDIGVEVTQPTTQGAAPAPEAAAPSAMATPAESLPGMTVATPPPVSTPAPEAVATPPAPLATPETVSPFTPGLEVAVPPAPTPSATAQAEGIIVDDKSPGAIDLQPNAQRWQTSANATDSYERASLIAAVDGTPKSATFKADIPAEGEYEIFLWWVASGKDFRSNAVPVTVYTAAGEKKTTVDQTSPTSNRAWNSIGVYPLKAGGGQKVLTITTEGIPAGPTINVSVDAIKLVKVR